MRTQKTARHIHVPENSGCREQILIAEDLTNKLNALLLDGVRHVQVSWIEIPDHYNDPTNRGFRIIASRTSEV